MDQGKREGRGRKTPPQPGTPEAANREDAQEKERQWSAGKQQQSGDTISSLEAAIQIISRTPGWRDADERILVMRLKARIDHALAGRDADERILACRARIEEIEAREIERERQEKLAREEAEARAKRNKKIAIIATPIVCAVIAFLVVLNAVIIPNGKYNAAVALMEAGEYEEAIAAFKALDGYKDSADQANSLFDKYKDEKLKDAKVGDYVRFGAYEQDNNASNGKEHVEWLVLDKKDGKALVISKYALDCKPYNTSDARNTGVTWETCSLREWLNSDFINATFSTDEKARIPMSTVSADKNPWYITLFDPGNATQDQVFLLSITEANQYFPSDSARQCEPTKYAVAMGAYVISSRCEWWLRASGSHSYTAANVSCGGWFHEGGDDVNDDDTAVRPALWIDLNA